MADVRGEPVQLAAGQNQQAIRMPYPVAAISINNFGEFFIFVEPSNRPGFWISPYQVQSIVNLYPPADSINISQQLVGPNGFSGAISNGGQGTVDMVLFDTSLSPQAGIISSPPAQFETATQIIDVVASFGGTTTVLTAPNGTDFIITKLAISPVSGIGGALLLSRVDLFWSEIPPPPAPFQPFSWDQSISQGSPYISESFEGASAVIHQNDALVIAASVDNFTYYTNAGLTVDLEAEVQFYRVNS